VSTAVHRCWVEISRATIAANYRAVAEAVGDGVEVMPVVKADAYRHGAVEVCRVLEREGVRWLAVSSVEEGVALRQAGIGARILVMADFLPIEREALVEHNLTPAIHSLEGIRELDQLASRIGKRLAYHLKVDTGMGRLGTRAATGEIADAVREAQLTDLEGLMTHFASAAVYSSNQTEQQLAAFEAIEAGLAEAGIAPRLRHLCATTPVAYGRKEAWRNMVRPGHAIYGYVSPVLGEAPLRTLDVRPVLEWKAAILEVKEVPKGARIGYGGMFEAPDVMRIATISAGYADGVPHRLSNRGSVLLAGRRIRILGAVSMDLITIDVTGVPGAKVGDTVTLLGRDGELSIDAQQIARLAGTISYSVLCGVSARVQRLYL